MEDRVGIKSIKKTSGLPKSQLLLLGWLNHQLFSYCPHLFKLTLSNKLQNNLSMLRFAQLEDSLILICLRFLL
jgi:hypothetical protein